MFFLQSQAVPHHLMLGTANIHRQTTILRQDLELAGNHPPEELLRNFSLA